ncbi:MAG TPA: PIG-L family deacetylase [Pyrinomonadaceae bacterium]|nr:PIG-L family deacetylase [Pyrinomonadaceae bacterium]
MCVAAHPDDEDGTTLTVLRRKYGVHTVSLFSTYGEGGQNAVGPELYEELGVIRAQETLAASEIQGSEPHFLGLRDFGFSKSAEETFEVWGQEEALRRMVQKIRELRPDVIITNHDTSRGHGHHQATGRLILEAFEAAADPKRFPEQLKRVSVWQPSRLFVRYRIPTGTSSTPTSTPAPDAPAPNRIVTIDPNERGPMRGTMYAEQALAALQFHATQGPWPKTIAERLATLGNPTKGLPLIGYQLVKEAPGVSPLPDDAKNFFDGLTLNEAVRSALEMPTIEDRPLIDFVDMPARVLNGLIAWRRRLVRSPEISPEHSHRARLIYERGNRALALASGTALTVAARSSELVPGARTTFTVNLSNLGDRNIKIDRLSFLGWGAGIRLEAAELLTPNTETTATLDLVTPAIAPLTVPKANHLYDGRLFGEPFEASADLEIEGAKFSLSSATNLPVTPAIEIKSLTPPVVVWTPGTLGQPWTFNATLVNHQAVPFAGHAEINASGIPLYADPDFQLEPHETRDIKFMGGGPPPKAIAQVQLETGTVTFSVGAKEVITSRHLRSVYSDAKVARGLRVGYLPSFDKTLAQSLAALGVAASELSVESIQNGTLDEYDTIIIDNRGYQAHPELIAANSKLLDRVRTGATLIVFYHKNDEWNPDEKKNRPQLAPYPIILGGDRVTEEDAPVKFLQPGHPLLNFPNRIRNADFDGWIQERGLYYPKEWDRRYQALLETAEREEPPLRGGLLVARYGRGNYIYTSMVWYRQLAAGVPGAYRTFANMISYGYKPGRRTATRPRTRFPSSD